MRAFILITAFVSACIGFVACSSPSEELPTPLTKPDTAKVKLKRGLINYHGNFDSRPDTLPDGKNYIVEYGIGEFLEADSLIIKVVDKQRALAFHGRTIDDQHRKNMYHKIYEDRLDTMDLWTNTYPIVNIDSIHVMQRDSQSGLLIDVSKDYSLVYLDGSDYVKKPPRLAYYGRFIQYYYEEGSYWVRTRVVSECDSLVCRWAFDQEVFPQLKPSPQAKPDHNTLVVITLTGGKKLIAPWEK